MAARDEPLAYFAALRACFDEAHHAVGGVIDRFYRIGGLTVRLRFAGPALLPVMTSALAHLVAEPDLPATLTVHLWDSASTGTKMLPPSWAPEDFMARGEIRGYNTERFFAAFQHGVSAFNMLDATSGEAVFWARAATAVPYYETGAPLRAILNWWLSRNARQLVHAAAVGRPSGGVLLGGKSGSGKSTTALACLYSSDLLYAGDDYALLEGGAPPVVHSLYNSAKVNADNIHRFPDLMPRLWNGERLGAEKALLFVHQHFPEKLARVFPIRAVLVPRITGRRETTVSRTSPAAGLTALAPSTIFQLPRAGGDAFHYLAGVVTRVPSYFLELGTDLAEIPGVIRNLLDQL